MYDQISVIVPVYNTERWLRRCVESILRQSYKKLEIILVDDGSTDISGKICDDYAQIDNRIKVIHQSNAGAHVARSRGLNLASGKWISFIDSDDYIDKDMYSNMLSSAENDSDIIWCGVVCEKKCNVKEYISPEKIYDKDQLVRNLLRNKVQGWMPNKIVKKKLLDDVDMSEAHMMFEDMFMSIQLYLNNPKITYLPDCYYHYNLTNTSASTAESQTIIFRKGLHNISLIKKYLEHKNVFDKFKADFANLAMRCKIAEANYTSLEQAKKIFPNAHKKMSSYPLNSWKLRLVYWIFFNTGWFGENLFKFRKTNLQ